MIAVVFISSGTGSDRSNFKARRIVGILSFGGVISIGLILNLSGVVGVRLVGDLSPSSCRRNAAWIDSPLFFGGGGVGSFLGRPRRAFGLSLNMFYSQNS